MLIIFEHAVDPYIDEGLRNFTLAKRTSPKSGFNMTSYKCFKTNTSKMFTISSSNWDLYPFFGIRADQT